MVAAAAGLEKTSALVAVEAGGTAAGPKVIGLILPVAFSMPLPERESERLPLEGVWEGSLPPPLCISGLLP